MNQSNQPHNFRHDQLPNNFELKKFRGDPVVVGQKIRALRVPNPVLTNGRSGVPPNIKHKDPSVPSLRDHPRGSLLPLRSCRYLQLFGKTSPTFFVENWIQFMKICKIAWQVACMRLVVPSSISSNHVFFGVCYCQNVCLLYQPGFWRWRQDWIYLKWRGSRLTRLFQAMLPPIK